jgi:hypothetical protein
MNFQSTDNKFQSTDNKFQSTDNKFQSTENITLIYKVISQSFQITREQINSSMNEYYKNNNINSSLTKEQLININKAYITYFKRITKNPTNILELTRNENTFPIEYTFEEIQNKKREQFNEELNKKQKEFSSFNQIVIPPPLKFNEDIDKPISEMEQLIAKTIAERTLDIESIHKKMEPPIRTDMPIKIKIEKSNLNLEEKHISWKDELPLDDFSMKEKINQIDIKLNLIIELLNNNKK